MKKLCQILGPLSLFIAFTMYMVGTTNDHLTELRDFFWAPLILSAVCFFAIKEQ